MVQETIVEGKMEALDVAMLQSIIEVSLQGSDATESSTIETDLGVAPLQLCPVTTKDEAIVDELLSQTMSEADISRLENIYGATN